MTKKHLACIILAAGAGTRMKSDLPKVLHPLAGKPMITWLTDTVSELQPTEIVTVISPHAAQIKETISPHKCAIQQVPQGTGDAVKAGMEALGDFNGDILILLGDMPLIQADTMRALIDQRYRTDACKLSVLGAEFETPPAFGRLVVTNDGVLERIVEDKDCTAEEKNIKLCNMGAFVVDAASLRTWLGELNNENAQGEYYITDIPEIAAKQGATTHVHIVQNQYEIEGVNSRSDLARSEKTVQNLLREKAMTGGATLIDPDTVYFSYDTELGRDVVIEPNVFFAKGVRIADKVTIRANSHLEQCVVESGAVIGPFARLRPGTHLEKDVKIGNFVEIKNAHLGAGAKANHLSYIGDAEVGAKTNFSCGAITANYDGFVKHKTIIGENVVVGCNVNLIAPVKIGDGAFIAAGSTLAKEVPSDALAVAREKPLIKDGWAAQNRQKKAG